MTIDNGASSDKTERVISPQRLVSYQDNWYLDAWCHLRDGLRAFSMDATKHAEILDKRSKGVADKRPYEVLGSGYGIFSGDDISWATLRFSPERSCWVASERWHPNQKAKITKDGTFEFKVPYADDRELIMDILKYGGDCQFVEPKGLCKCVAAEFSPGLAHYS